MSAPTILYSVRHGETIWNAEGRCQGHADADFPEAGHAQLRALTSQLAGVIETRVLPAFESIIAAHPGETVLVSSHGYAHRRLLAAHLNRGTARRLECRPALTP